MQDMRFGQFPKEEKSAEEGTRPYSGKRKSLKVFAALVVICLLAAIVVEWKYNFIFKNSANSDDTFSAVFLANGQVYFGKIAKNTRSDMVLKDVYYIQTAKNEAEASELSMELVKLGGEIHGPTDELFINKSHIIFWENLRLDSKILEAIKNNKK